MMNSNQLKKYYLMILGELNNEYFFLFFDKNN
jgi:hypothetical protein